MKKGFSFLQVCGRRKVHAECTCMLHACTGSHKEGGMLGEAVPIFNYTNPLSRLHSSAQCKSGERRGREGVREGGRGGKDITAWACPQ